MQGNRISLDRQLQNHQYTVSHIIEMLGGYHRATIYLSKCMYSITIGSNDYLSNYFLPMFYPTSQQYTPEQYAKLLIQQLTQQLMVSANSFTFIVVVVGSIMNKMVVCLFIDTRKLNGTFLLILDFVQIWSKEGSPLWIGSAR